MLEQKPSISACFIWLFFGLVCCTSLVLVLINAISGNASEGFSIGRLLTGIVGISMLYRGISGFQANRVNNPMPKSLVWFIWIVIGVPTALSLWGIILAILNFSDYWSYLINVIPVVIGILAIASAYENKTDAFHLIKVLLIIQAIGVVSLLLNLIDSATPLNIGLFVFKFVLVVVGFLYLYLSKDISAIMPPESRTKSKLGKWLLIICVVIYVAVFALGIIGLLME